MPYIPQQAREDVFGREVHLGLNPLSPGELNYILTRIIHDHLQNVGVNYANINSVIGVLECAKLELYRQIASPYEDEKKKTNGPVSRLDGG